MLAGPGARVSGWLRLRVMEDMEILLRIGRLRPMVVGCRREDMVVGDVVWDGMIQLPLSGLVLGGRMEGRMGLKYDRSIDAG